MQIGGVVPWSAVGRSVGAFLVTSAFAAFEVEIARGGGGQTRSGTNC